MTRIPRPPGFRFRLRRPRARYVTVFRKHPLYECVIHNAVHKMNILLYYTRRRNIFSSFRRVVSPLDERIKFNCSNRDPFSTDYLNEQSSNDIDFMCTHIVQCHLSFVRKLLPKQKKKRTVSTRSQGRTPKRTRF